MKLTTITANICVFDILSHLRQRCKEFWLWNCPYNIIGLLKQISRCISAYM